MRIFDFGGKVYEQIIAESELLAASRLERLAGIDSLEDYRDRHGSYDFIARCSDGSAFTIDVKYDRWIDRTLNVVFEYCHSNDRATWLGWGMKADAPSRLAVVGSMLGSIRVIDVPKLKTLALDGTRRWIEAENQTYSTWSLLVPLADLVLAEACYATYLPELGYWLNNAA